MSRGGRAQKASASSSVRGRAPREEKYSLLDDGDQKLPEKKVCTKFSVGVAVDFPMRTGTNGGGARENLQRQVEGKR